MSKTSGPHNPDDVLIGFLDSPEVKALTALVAEAEGSNVSDLFRRFVFARAEAHGMMRGGNPPKGKVSDANAHLAPKALRRTEAQIAQANKDVRRWKLRQKMWIRESMPFGHAFTSWNNKYLETHPEYLALQKNGERGISNKKSRDAKYMKLCVSNEDVVDVIVENYVKAGKPKYYNICPNDGYHFCRCEKCKALDCPQTDDERELKISKAVNLTDRYVNFWNRIAKKIVAIRPDVSTSGTGSRRRSWRYVPT